jgi:hypothetical protein
MILPNSLACSVESGYFVLTYSMTRLKRNTLPPMDLSSPGAMGGVHRKMGECSSKTEMVESGRVQFRLSQNSEYSGTLEDMLNGFIFVSRNRFLYGLVTNKRVKIAKTLKLDAFIRCASRVD